MTDIERAIKSCENKIKMYEKRYNNIDFNRGSTLNSITLEKVKIQAMQEKAERDKMRCANCEYGCPADYGICSCSAHKMIDTDYDTYCSYFEPKESEGKTDEQINKNIYRR